MAHALILGASGISGWGILNQIGTYPTSTFFSHITGTTTRPFSLEKAHLSATDTRYCLVSGIDFTKRVEEVAKLLKDKVPSAETISHVFFTAYVHKDDPDELKEVNTTLVRTAIIAIEMVSTNLKTVIMQTGGKGYGAQYPLKLNTPFSESLPRIPSPYAESVFYYSQVDVLKELSAGKSWTFTEIRPDVVVGFVPGSNVMNFAQGLGMYLALCKEVNGGGSSVPFPGTENGFRAFHTDTSQDILARMEIFAAINIDNCGNGEAFNVGNETVSWSQVWPGVCQYFGLIGEGPEEGGQSIEEFVTQNVGAWEKLAGRTGIDPQVFTTYNWLFVHFMLVVFDFNRQYDLTKAKAVGFTDEVDTVEGYRIAWDRMRAAKFLP
ncbi:hypothetical protein BKA64DRAFT_62366 [Cadophora sp. MPI-SDFR-AT-0126]|nr:hypothetical protein BKA64DRAFT_62366 [Leotiomycetes sp. MPI-SDFR-AT-0126]